MHTHTHTHIYIYSLSIFSSFVSKACIIILSYRSVEKGSKENIHNEKQIRRTDIKSVYLIVSLIALIFTEYPS